MFRVILTILFYCSMLFSQVLNVDEAFNISTKNDEQGIVFNFKFGENIYVYKDTFSVLLNDQNINNKLKLPIFEDYGEYRIIKDGFDILIPKELINENLKNNKATVTLNYQGCSKNGICYRPQVKIYEISQTKDGFNIKESIPNSDLAEDEMIAKNLQDENFALSIATFFGYGLLLALTPCVFPMIPILSSIIVAKGGSLVGSKYGFMLSLIYVTGMSLAYAVAGMVASFMGLGLSGALQNTWVLGAFSLIFIALAFSMFGFYDIRLPAKFQNLINKNSQNRHGLLGVFIMGFASALIVSPCVAAPLAGALLYIAQSANAIYGGIVLFFMGLGMGVPLLIIGASSGKILPRPGIWMDNIKMIFGFLMLAMAIWLSARIFGSMFELVGYGVVGVVAVVFLGLFDATTNGVTKAKKAALMLILIYSIMLIIGGFSGAKDPLLPLKNFNNTQIISQQDELNFKQARNLDELMEIIKSSNKPVMLDFWASWCVSCKELEETTFKDSEVIKRLKDFTLVRIDVTKRSIQNDEMLREFGLIDPPALLFFKDGKQLNSKRIIGFINTKDFLDKTNGI